MGCAARREGTREALLGPLGGSIPAATSSSWCLRMAESCRRYIQMGENPTTKAIRGDREAIEQQNYWTKMDRGWGNLTRLAGTLALPPRIATAQSSKGKSQQTRNWSGGDENERSNNTSQKKIKQYCADTGPTCHTQKQWSSNRGSDRRQNQI
jgi:hypothetical protein